MPETETQAERQVRLMRVDMTRALDDVLASLQSVTRGGGRLAESGGNVLEREFNMAVSLSEQIRDSIFSEESLHKARSQPLNGRIRHDGHRLVDLLADVGGVTAHTVIRAADEFFAQRPRLVTEEEIEAARAESVPAGASHAV